MVCIFKGVLIIGLIYLEKVDGDILLKDNRYDGTVVAIDRSIPEDENLLAKLKVSLQEASEVLFQATRKQVYFGTILIQLPQTWTTLTAQLKEHHQYVTGDIIIDSPPKYHGDRPFTMQPLGCGIPGDFTILPPEFLTRPDPTYGPIAKILVHEWGHLRFGLFDEYPVKDSQNFYTDLDGKVAATKCPAFLTGDIKNDKGGNCLSPNDACVYTDHQQTGSYASLMYKTNLEHVNQFCDNDTENEATLHNVDAPTEQNALCERKAAWQVLREHADFVGDNSTLNEAPPINFIEYKIQRERTVVVMDVSGSMRGYKIDKMSKAVRKYLSTVVRDGVEVGLVKFAEKSQTVKLHELTVVSAATRKTLVAAVPTVDEGYTCIGCGIEVALAMLNPDKSPNNKGGTMIILSDGEENEAPYIYEKHDEVLKQEVTVHSIALTQSASSNLDALAIVTKGRTFIYDFNEESNALNEAFETLSELHTDPHDKNIQLLSKIYVVDKVREDYIVIDKTIGRGTKFIFDYEGAAIQFVLTSPTGVQYTQDDADHSDSHIYVISMGDVIQNGSWRYLIMNKDSSSTRVVVTVTSKASNPERPPIIAHPFWSHRDGLPRIGGHNLDIPVLFARVSQGYSPVIGATVVATITDPNGKVHEKIPLTDNGGSDFDTHKDDGIYGTYFKAYAGKGRYGVRIWVVGGEKTVIDHRRIIGRGAPSNETDDDSEKETTGMFTRFASAGAYNVTTVPEKYPPGRIKSLSLVGVDPPKQMLVLTWFATGSELNFGIASHYVIRYSSTVSELQDDFESQSKVEQEDILLGQLNQPKASGTLETFILRFPNVEIATVFYAVVAYDTDGRVVNSGVSNVISVLLTSPQFIPPTIAPILNPPNPPAPAPGFQQPNDPQNHDDPEIPVHASTPAPTNGSATQGNTTSTTPGTNATSQSVNKGPTVTEQAMMIGIPLLVVTVIFSVVLYIMHMKNKRPITPKSDIAVSLSDPEEAIEEKDTKGDPQEGTSKSTPVCVAEPDNGVDIGIVKVKPACVIAVDTDNDKAALKAKCVREAGDLGSHFQTPPAATYLPKAKTLYKD